MKIKILDDLHPEDNAMLQALYSRSKESVDDHLEKVKRVGSGKFMGQYYVGYGHKSIADCGTTTIFIEGVSMLAAKAIQDWPLYNGQEKSTRYIDFTEVEFTNPIGMDEGDKIQDAWRSFYKRAKDPVIAHLRSKYPMQPDEKEGRYDKAIRSRAFDILRGFLPAGAQTQLSWHTNLRQAYDHLNWMFKHPLDEVSGIANKIFEALAEKYPHSFPMGKWGDEDTWMSKMMDDHHLTHCPNIGNDVGPFYYHYAPDNYPEHRALSQVSEGFLRIPNAMRDRPRGAPIPHWLDELGQIRSRFYLDFGSYRDIQRHRNGVIRMPLLRHEAPIHQWYIEQLPEHLQTDAAELVMEQRADITRLYEMGTGTKYTNQYYCPMGNLVPIQVTQGLPGFLYRLELRSSKAVHPTLRQVVLREAKVFRGKYPWVALHTDDDPDSWTVRRGDQDIIQKSST